MSVKNFIVNNKWVILLWFAAMTPLVIIVTLLSLTAMGSFGRLPSFEELENPKSNLATEIFSEDGVLLGTYYIENRSYLPYEELYPLDSTNILTLNGYQVPPLIAALISTEDERFREHGGVDIRSLYRVGIKTLMLQNTSQGGGSTISQQLAKNLFPRDTTRYPNQIARYSKLVTTKLKEWITAVKLERSYTKEEIMAIYLNTVTYGSNAYGIKAAAETFFGKQPNELSIEESALLVGVVNAPTRYSPVRNPKSSLNRRNVVLARMAKTGAISEAQYDSLKSVPITLNYKPANHNDGSATYFREMLRLTMNASAPERKQYNTKWDYDQAVKQYEQNPIYGWCQKNTKADGTPYNIYRDGLRIYTTINSKMQGYAEEAMQKQMEDVIQPMMDAQVKAQKSIYVDAPIGFEEQSIENAMRYGNRYFHMKSVGRSHDEIMASYEEKREMKVFTFKGIRDTVMTPRDSILHYKSIMRASFVAMDPYTGGVKAYIGGPNFRYFKYDMAKQGKRQMGSTIKPLLYTFAIDHLGLNPCTQVPNLPVTIDTGGSVWSPKESGNVVYDGVMHPLKWGLAKSRNNYSAWIMKEAKQPRAVAEFINNMGIRSYVAPVPSLALGSSESNVFEMVSAYATFVNKGIYTEPIFVTRIEDRHGNVIANFTPNSQDQISKETAYTMLEMLKGVVSEGTAIRLTWAYGMYRMDVGGKTGTSQLGRDAWFIGVLPKLVTGAWVGGEEQYIHLRSRGEGSVMALPIVGEFYNRIYKDKSLGFNKTDKFERPIGMEPFDCNKVTTTTTKSEESQSETSSSTSSDVTLDFF